MIVKNVFEGKDYRWPTHTNSLLIDRKDTQGSEVFLTTIEPKRFTHRHIHKENEQLYYVIKGKGVIICRSKKEKKDREVRIKKGEVVFIPIQTEHKVFCKGEEPLVYLTIDIFPKGKPKGELTWESHAKKLKIETKNG